MFITNTQLFTSQDINWWTGDGWITCGLLWCFCQLFQLSFWRHPFTADDPLVSKWCNADFLQNSSTSWMAWGSVNIQQMFNYCFKRKFNFKLNWLLLNIFYFFYRNVHRQNEWLWHWFSDGGCGSSRLRPLSAFVTTNEQKRTEKGKDINLENGKGHEDM